MTLLDSVAGNLPQGIRLKTHSGFSFHNYHIQPRQTISCRAGILSIEGAALSVDLRTARKWRADLTTMQIVLAHRATHRAWETAWATLCANRPQHGLAPLAGESFTLEEGFALYAGAPPLARKAAPAMTALLQATQMLDSNAACASIKPLIGLGPGVTPSGDDFLIGYLAALWSTAGRGPQRRAFLSAIGAQIAQLAAHTNTISRAYLLHAGGGDVSEWLAALIQAIGAGKTPAAVQPLAARAIQVGHTSGADSVTGLLAGLKAWQHQPITAQPFRQMW